jgi:hypothetical protein
MDQCQFFDGETVQDIAEISQFLAEEWTRIHQNDPQPQPNYDELSMAYERYDDAMVVANNA